MFQSIETLFHIMIAVSLIALLINTVRNHFKFKVLSPNRLHMDEYPLVSILVPARNEESCIKECIESLCKIEYPHIEIIVLDDNSTDATGQILHDLQTIYPNKLTIIKGTPLPHNWVGKPYACYQLAQKAKGNYLLFTDADTKHHPKSLDATIQHAIEQSYDVLSIIPKQHVVHFWEQVTVPFIHLLYMSYMPNDLLYKTKHSIFTAANGQALLCKKSFYNTIGGHQAVFNSIAEDIDLGIITKKHNGKLGMISAGNLISCRMYKNRKEVFEGFSKNSFATLRFDAGMLLVFITHLFLTYILPFFLVPYYILTANTIMISVIIFQICCILLLRFTIARFFGNPWYHMFLQPLTAASFIVLSINSAIWFMRKKGTTWKGRSYTMLQKASNIVKDPS